MSKAKGKPNMKLLREVRRMIRNYPEHFNMYTYSSLDGRETLGRLLGCETVACIGGWAVALHNMDVPKRKRLDAGYATGAQVLNLSDDQAGFLFQTDAWPVGVRDKCLHGETPKIRANAAAKMITKFIRLKGKV